MAQLQKNRDYAGETWTIDAKQFGGSSGGMAEIAVAAVEGESSQRRITIAAEYPADTPARARYEKKVIVELTASNETSPESP